MMEIKKILDLTNSNDIDRKFFRVCSLELFCRGETDVSQARKARGLFESRAGGTKVYGRKLPTATWSFVQSRGKAGFLAAENITFKVSTCNSNVSTRIIHLFHNLRPFDKEIYERNVEKSDIWKRNIFRIDSSIPHHAHNNNNARIMTQFCLSRAFYKFISPVNK